MNDAIFKSYDIRGISDEDITEELAYKIGNAFAQEQELTRCVVSRDVRENSPAFAKQAIQGLRDAGCDVIDAGITSTSQLKWIVAQHELPAGLMITASHNPPEYNGFKFYLDGGRPYAQADGMHALKDHLDSPATDGDGSYEEHDYTKQYIDFITQGVAPSDTEVFLDPSGGAACKEVKTLAETGDYNLILYNADQDPQFRAHEPNPLEPSATETAQEYCKMHRTIGCVLDADADRLVLIDENGQIVPPDFLLALLAKNLPEGSGVVATLNCSYAVQDTCEQHGLTYERVAVGSANVQRSMREHGHALGGEKSGHIFFTDVGGAEAPLLCLLQVLEHYDHLADAVRPLRENYIGSTEHNYHVSDQEAVIEHAKQELADYDISTLDGVLAEGEDWWLSIRQSNTEPVVRFTWEARNQEKYQELEGLAESIAAPFTEQD